MIPVIEFIGRFHPVLVHLPIGMLITSLLLQWLSRKESYHISPQVIKLVLFCGMIAAVLACLTGSLLSLSGDYDESLVSWHMWMGFAVAICSMFLFMKLAKKEVDFTYKVLCFGLLLLITVTGHLGGSLTHGSDYLTGPLTSVSDSNLAKQKTIVNIQEAKVYADVIDPILQSKCYGCHGPKKQKGKLRMDDPQLLMKGGKDGVVIMPFNAEKSELIKRLLLPDIDEHHMPPKEKPPLNEKQIALLHWWIDQGADFNKKVKELSQPDKLASYLLALQSDHIPAKKVISDIPAEAIEKADDKAISALKSRGIMVNPVSQNSNYLAANFVTATNINNKDLALLLPIKKQLAWLKLGNTNISDSALTYISECHSLTVLQLNNTDITDKGLTKLNSLQNLQSLNLVATKITEQALMQLRSLKKLQSLYLYQTAINKINWNKLKAAFPKTLLDSGGYEVPFLATDTMVVKAPPESKPAK